MQDVILWAMSNTLPILGLVLIVTVIATLAMLKDETKSVSSSESGYGHEQREERVSVPKVKPWKSGVADKWESDEHRALLVMCMGDVDKAERLITFEKSKAPHGSRSSWIKEAIARWGRDLHRL